MKDDTTNKLYPDAPSALAGVVQDGQTIAVGGFGVDGFGFGQLLETRQS